MSRETSALRRETVTAFFESRTEAEAVLDRLSGQDIDVSDARLFEGGSNVPAETDLETRRKGFWETLSDLFLPQEDRGTYAEALSRGGTLLSIPVLPADRSRVIDLIDEERAVDIDEQQTTRHGTGESTAASPTAGLAAPTDDAGLRSGISGIGAHAAGAPPASLAREADAAILDRRDDSIGRRRVRSSR